MAFFRKKKEIPLGLWMKCPSPACGKMAFTKTVEENLHVCPDCGFHMKISAAVRVRHLVDDGTWEPLADDLEPRDVLRFVDSEPYETKIQRASAKSGVSEAALVGRGRLGGRALTLCVMDFAYMGGSMGVVVGERFARGAEDALERRVPFLTIATSGGARMHEGALSLMQMAKTSAMVARLREARVPYVTLLADPCTGGVSASFAAQGDLTLAEPGALIGFAGPRVIESTIKTTLPEGFQRSEFLLEHGYIDRIVPRARLKDELGAIFDFLVRPAAATGTAPPGALTVDTPLELEIRTVKVELVRPLRREVLRTGQPPQAAEYPGDDDPLALHLAAYDDGGAVVGIATLCKPEDRMAGHPPYVSPGLRFRGLAVRPDRVRMGVGTQLLRQLRELAREREVRELWANARETALPFFLARRFKVVSSPFEVPAQGTHVVIADAP